MATGFKSGGRQKGTPNRIGGSVRDNVVRVFDGLGGETAMQAWAAENQTEFYRLYSKLLPTDVTLAGGEDGSNPVSLMLARADELLAKIKPK